MFSKVHDANNWSTSNKKVVNDEHFKYPNDFQLGYQIAGKRTNNPFFKEFRELIFAMAVCGRFPFHRDYSGSVKFSLLSMSWLYWLLIYSFFATISASMFGESYAQILGEKSFDVAIFSARNCALLMQVFVMPLSNCREWRCMADYINDMEKFVVNFERLTGKKLLLGMRYFVVTNVLICPILAIGGGYVERESLGIKNVYHQLLYLLLYCGASYFSWLLFCGQWMIWRVAHYLQCELSKVASRSRRKINVSALHIHKLKCIWVNGTELLLENGRAPGFTILVIVLMNSFLIVLGSYGLLMSIANCDLNAASHQLLNVSANLAWMVLYCEAGLRSTEQMGNKITALLSSIDITGLSELAALEVTIFLHVVSLHPPVIKCGGMISLNRSFLSSVLSNTLTYLIVLVQFKKAVSEPSEDLETITSPGSEVLNQTLNST